MVITRTPYRVSLFGGGTDYPIWFSKHGGRVLAGSIDKYCYLSVRWLPPFHTHKHRILWSKNEMVNEIDEIEHPCVRETLKYFEIQNGVEIHHDGDLPARSGMGSSSSFAVGLIYAVAALTGKMMSKMDLAHAAIKIEQEVLKDMVGCQDQTTVAYGGFNLIDFNMDSSISVSPWVGSQKTLGNLQKRLCLFFTGMHRTASEIASNFVPTLEQRKDALSRLYGMVGDALALLNEGKYTEVGKLLDESWEIKRSLSDEVSNERVDDLYLRAKEAGMIGGKLLGVGGGGFFLTLSPIHSVPYVKSALYDLIHVPFSFENEGSKIIYYDRSACKRPAVWGM